MRYLSVCSGIEAASVTWEPLDWEPAGFSEIEPFPCAVLKHRFPNVTNYGDMTKFKEWKNVGTVDVLVGGTPCQSFSVAGLRKGLADPRGNLMLTFGAIAHHFKARWVVWENVPGVLSSHGGRDFGTFLGMLAELGYGFAYRVCNAEFFGVAQRRRRVFVVGYLGDWRPPAAVLFESESLSGNIKKGEKAACGFARSLKEGTAQHRAPVMPPEQEILAMASNNTNAEIGKNIMPTLRAQQRPFAMVEVHAPANIYLMDQGGSVMNVEYGKTGTLRANAGGHQPTLRTTYPGMVVSNLVVRYLTPVECERLQGFLDNHTRIPYRGKPAEQCPKSPRYKALGNSMAVPVMRWIGERIDKVQKMMCQATKQKDKSKFSK